MARLVRHNKLTIRILAEMGKQALEERPATMLFVPGVADRFRV